jgi:uncharacterized protein (TIGR00645 family)
MKKFQHFLEVFIFGARWLLAPLYIGLVGALVILLWRYSMEFISLVQNVNEGDSHLFTLDLLGLLDLVLLGNLVLIVLFAGYENFVSKMEIAEKSTDRPSWMGTIDFSGLKLKLIGSLVALSVIELLKDFIELSNHEQDKVGDGTIWRIVIHLTFVVSGVLFAVMDRLGEVKGKHLTAGD